MSQLGFFDLEDRYAALSKAGDPLPRLKDVVNFETFRYRLEKAQNRSDRARGGGPLSYDCVLMFKILVLQALYNLSGRASREICYLSSGSCVRGFPS